MKETLSQYEIANRLIQDEYAGWSYAGAEALAAYLEEYEESTGSELEFDRVAIRCDFSEHGSALEAAEQCDFEPDEDEDEDEQEESALAYLRDQTSVIPFKGGVIIQDF